MSFSAAKRLNSIQLVRKIKCKLLFVGIWLSKYSYFEAKQLGEMIHFDMR